VRAATGISRHPVSVASAAVRLALMIFPDLAGRRVLVVGAGKMGTLVAKHLVSSGAGDVFVTSRTFHHAVAAAARVLGQPLHWAEGLSRLAEVDIVISCTGAPHAVLTRTDVAAASRRRRGAPLFVIDIALPRDVEPAVKELDNVHVYDVDGLQGIADAHMQMRREAAEQAWRLVAAETVEFERWRKSLEVEPVIVDLREHLLEIRRQETERFRRRLGSLSPDQEEAVHALTRALVQKFLHRPVEHLRQSVDRGDGPASAAAYREIFGMGEGPDPDAPAGERPGDDDDAPDPRHVVECEKD
jgi:glutamyl-tRNA reductase